MFIQKIYEEAVLVDLSVARLVGGALSFLVKTFLDWFSRISAFPYSVTVTKLTYHCILLLPGCHIYAL